MATPKKQPAAPAEAGPESTPAEAPVAAAPAKAKAKAAPAPTIVSLGSISTATASIVLGAGEHIDGHWRSPGNIQSDWFIDVTGPEARRLARTQGTYPSQELSDGTWRVTVPNMDFAKVLHAQIKQSASPEHKVLCYPRHASRVALADAARETGVGFSNGFLAIKRDRVAIEAVLGPDGKPTELRIKL